MVFDIICTVTILGLALKGIKELFFNRLALIVSLIIAFSLSSVLMPIYGEYIRLPINLSSNISSFILTFILAYLLLTLPGFFLKVAVGGIILIIIYGVILNFIPLEYQKMIVQNSYIYSFIKPIVWYILILFRFLRIIK
ncbi:MULTISPECIES: hypothetical protein [Dictyoglomus]|jgi:hypothetical protein|uniref:Uncharacterized protein n=1 Tax=Dictyoglomus turgidum (strain DSM 6724 / Z-1310) TaxID=515635 RepID=B8DZN8_DICTD|nr:MULTISPECIES: hypothetical protein [Dictyoglomus]ACK41971.1 conserved hypothetical protein [Dictyoglomus turgidum DSM 6724]PNV79285.1 MAG: hypothetical protein C0196_06265 [Dictyoglomus turgidum]HBU31469.1 hypothetical protein [Dictyoglomus sp.]